MTVMFLVSPKRDRQALNCRAVEKSVVNAEIRKSNQSEQLA